MCWERCGCMMGTSELMSFTHCGRSQSALRIIRRIGCAITRNNRARSSQETPACESFILAKPLRGPRQSAAPNSIYRDLILGQRNRSVKVTSNPSQLGARSRADNCRIGCYRRKSLLYRTVSQEDAKAARGHPAVDSRDRRQGTGLAALPRIKRNLFGIHRLRLDAGVAELRGPHKATGEGGMAGRRRDPGLSIHNDCVI